MDYCLTQKVQRQVKAGECQHHLHHWTDSNVNSLTKSEKEEEVLAADITRPLAAATHLGQPCLRNYDDSPVQQLEPSQEQVKESAEQPKTTPEKPREVRYNR